MVWYVNLLWSAVFIYGVLYACSLWKYSYWKRKGIHGPMPEFLFGNLKESTLRRKNLALVVQDLYTQTKLPYLGIFSMYRKTLLVKDLDLIKDIFVKNFEHFTDRSLKLNSKTDPLSLHLVNLTGETWKDMRAKLTPTFTTTKMKYMFETMVKCNHEMMQYLEASEDSKCDVKELYAKLNTNVIGSCAFGIDCNTFTSADQKFRIAGTKMTTLSFCRGLKRSLAFSMPALYKLLGLSFADKDNSEFFINLVKSTVQYRKENNVRRNDFMQILIDMKGGYKSDEDSNKSSEGSGLTTLEIAAQVFVFFAAGFETSSSAASFALYELALNPDIQNTVRAEIREVLSKHGGKATYESLGEMTYLTRVIEESLRKYPPAGILTRNCTKEFNIPGTDITIEKDTVIMVPILAIQRDPNIYPDPLKFDPDRFAPESKSERHNFSFLAFGEGPRVCIGKRFGMLQVRLALVSILSKYEVSVCKETPIPIQFSCKSFLLISDSELFLTLKKI